MDFGTYNAIVYNGNAINEQGGIRALNSQTSTWDVRQLTQDQQSAAWFIRSQIEDSQSAAWHVTNTVTKSSESSWAIRVLASASIQASWFIWMFAEKFSRPAWQILEKTSRVLHLHWDKSSPKGPPSLRAGLVFQNQNAGLVEPQKVTAGLVATRTKPAIIRSNTFATITDEIN